MIGHDVNNRVLGAVTFVRDKSLFLCICTREVVSRRPDAVNCPDYKRLNIFSVYRSRNEAQPIDIYRNETLSYLGVKVTAARRKTKLQRRYGQIC